MKKNKLVKLFLSMLKISAFTFGGGFVIVPLMRERFVNELKWIEDEEMVDLTAIAQSSPGAIAVNAAIAVGYRVAGVAGALIAALGAILPPLVIISVVSVFYDEFRSNVYVNAVMKGMLAGIAAIILNVVVKMGKDIVLTKRIMYYLIFIVSFVLVRFLKVSVAFIILGCIIIGIIDAVWSEKRKESVK